MFPWRLNDVLSSLAVLMVTASAHPASSAPVSALHGTWHLRAARLSKFLQIGGDKYNVPTASQNDPAAAAQILQTVAAEQLQLFDVLTAATVDLDATEKRAQADLAAITLSKLGNEDLINRTLLLNDTTIKNEAAGALFEKGLPELEKVANHTKATEAKEKTKLNEITKKLLDGGGSKDAGKRADDGLQVLGVIAPKLDKMENKVDQLEALNFYGNLSNLVADTTNIAVDNVIEDVGRGLAIGLPDF